MTTLCLPPAETTLSLEVLCPHHSRAGDTISQKVPCMCQHVLPMVGYTQTAGKTSNQRCSQMKKVLLCPGRGVPGAELVRHHSTKHSWEILSKVMTFNTYVSKDLVLSACAQLHTAPKKSLQRVCLLK